MEVEVFWSFFFFFLANMETDICAQAQTGTEGHGKNN